MEIQLFLPHCPALDEIREPTYACELVPCPYPGSTKANVPTASATEIAGVLPSEPSTGGQGEMTREQIELLSPVSVQTLVHEHPYLDVLDVALLLRRPPCLIRSLAEAGLIPAHALRHEEQTCWKFRLSELLDWAAEIGVETSPKALSDLLSFRNEAQ